MFKNRKLFKDFVSGVKEHRYTRREVADILETLPIKVLRKIAKKIIYLDYDGHDDSTKYSYLVYFDSLDRWQKEFFIKERLHKLCV